MERPASALQRPSYTDNQLMRWSSHSIAIKWDLPTDNRGLPPCGNTAAYNRKEPIIDNCTTYVATDTHKKQHNVALLVRRDAKKLLGRFVAEQLTQVYPPNAEQEAARELTRSRQIARENIKRTRHQLLKSLTRQGIGRLHLDHDA